MGFNFNIGWGNNQPLSVERNANGDFFYQMFSSATNHKRLLTDAQKINAILSNPACLKVFALNCDLFSLGVVNQVKDGTITVPNFLKEQTPKPNVKQGWSQFFWDYCFYNMLGTAYLWKPTVSRELTETSQIQWLNPANIVWESNTTQKLKSLILGQQTLKDILKKNYITYNLGNGQDIRIPLNEITPIHDLTSGLSGNFYKGISRVDALYKIISNSESSLDAKNINLEFSQKYMVNGKNSIENISELPMGETEKVDIENKIRSNKNVFAVKTPIDVKRFVDDIARLKLDECFYNDYFMIGSMFGIPKDILETTVRSSTYENQEKATGRHLEYTIKPKAVNLLDALSSLFGFDGLEMSWQHLAFNQVFEVDRVAVQKTRLENLKVAVDLGLGDKEKQAILKTIII